MPDRRRHRGPHPRDAALFAAAQHDRLRHAVAELSWLLSRGYPEDAALKLVGDRHALVARQRTAVRRAACTDGARSDRRARRVGLEDVAGRALWVDGFNVVIVAESRLSGGVVFRGRDGALRDLASVHGTWRRVDETARAIEALADALAAAGPSAVRWLLDAPVSNSGRLAALLREAAEARGVTWDVEAVADPDGLLVAASGADPRAVVATADAAILDRCGAWLDLPAEALPGAPPPLDVAD